MTHAKANHQLLICARRPARPPATGANFKSISHRCYPILLAFVWELTKTTIDLPLGCLQGGERPAYDVTHAKENHQLLICALLV